jgi:acetyl-CoA C-acetyltransferase
MGEDHRREQHQAGVGARRLRASHSKFLLQTLASEAIMTRNVAIVGAAALPVRKWQTAPAADLQVLEHEVLAKVVIEAVNDARLEKKDIASLAFAQPRPYTTQKYFATFIANYLRLPCTGSVSELALLGGSRRRAFYNDTV